MIRWLINGLKIADIAFNWFPLLGREVETFSRRAGRARHDGKRWGCVVCVILDAVVRRLTGRPDHCETSRTAGKIV